MSFTLIFCVASGNLLSRSRPPFGIYAKRSLDSVIHLCLLLLLTVILAGVVISSVCFRRPNVPFGVLLDQFPSDRVSSLASGVLLEQSRLV